ncbi:glycosyl hydrolases family 38 N-terminal domain-containing protein [Phlyctochytrium arcticum]|nr:glycosyl hydrolases family 38 N-terminal domain-containing protein [Phlyctochytrium arcticum]
MITSKIMGSLSGSAPTGSDLKTTALQGMQKHRKITTQRIEKFLADGQFRDVNIHAVLTAKEADQDAVQLEVYSVEGLERIPFDQAIKGTFKPTKIGEMFGPTWSTHWFRVTISVPKEFAGERVQFLFDPSAEALIWSESGEPLMGITGDKGIDRHVDFWLTEKAKGGETIKLYIETACNGMFGAGRGNDPLPSTSSTTSIELNSPGGGLINPPDENRYYRLATASILVPFRPAVELHYQLQTLLGMMTELEAESQASCDALYTANQMVNTVVYDDQQSVVRAAEIGREFFKKRLNTGYEQHVITAIGNCHIDTAWLWPYDETKRKAARSFATQCGLIEQYPSYVFAASQAQQFEWVEELYPPLFNRMKRHAKSGKFLPIGGTWVEMDCNVPSGEAFCRQFLYGQRYFERAFGHRCKVFWLPDTFGYSAQLPQIIKESDLEYFFTQKLSWNNINTFPHTTFMWTGLDGSSVLTHFSPADTYTAQATVKEVCLAVKNNKDKAYSNQSLLLFGNGDGGGGPNIPMLERLTLMQNVAGLPATVKFGNPNDFYDTLAKTSHDLNEWRGELYFELHRGTYTSQADVKKHNRQSEMLLRDVEAAAALAVTLGAKNYAYPRAELDRVWKLVLLNQFHDVLPGSSIEIVYDDAARIYKDVLSSGTQMLADALQAFASTRQASPTAASGLATGFSTLPWPRAAHVVAVPLEGTFQAQTAQFVQVSADGKQGVAVMRETGAYGCASLVARVDSLGGVTVEETAAGVTTTNAHIKVVIDKQGRLTSLFDISANRETVRPGYASNVFKLYEDIPLFWDAWDVEVYHLEKGWTLAPGSISIEERGPLRVVIKAEHKISEKSHIVQRIIVAAGGKLVEFENWVEWHENRRILKVEFPVDVHNDFATYETQFGFIRRPTHFNNSWDMARFEVCAHKFVDYSENGFGVTLLNDSKYGFAVHDQTMHISLLRAPKAPDAHCDMGSHFFKYALYPHTGTFLSDVVRVGYEFNCPVRNLPGQVTTGAASEVGGMFEVDRPEVVLETIKMAEDVEKGKLVLRLFESCGSRGKVTISSSLNIKSVHRCNILEDVKENVPVKKQARASGTGEKSVFEIDVGPFKLVSLILEV